MVLKSLINVRNKYFYQMSTWRESMSEIKTFVFLDLESTGLPLYENNKTRITELCLTAVQAEHIRLGVFPRVQNKLNLCFNPCKLISADAEKITGLSNFLLENTKVFSQETVSSINHFLNHNPQPVCLVAHNGLNFDYPLLKREVDKTEETLDDNVLCVDTLVAFREIECEQQIKKENAEEKTKNAEKGESSSVVASGEDTIDATQSKVPVEFTANYDKLLVTACETIAGDKLLFSAESQIKNETTPQKQIITNRSLLGIPKKSTVGESIKILDFSVSYKLGDVFSRLTKKAPSNSHQADGDVQMLIMCAATLGDTFVDWCNQNAKKFSDIPAMVPGKKIGT
ncbi:three-prime repair exonuclease 1 isoform X2 [Diabrotica undecimpunctata]|uniref:three-prime repair exonuclease 1 isoform X2 n=1 Tax=Diabrotica undecimpunctata TaxID=50387 RepID=UPI003B63815C